MVTVLLDFASVTGEVVVRILFEVDIDEAVVIAVERARLSWPRVGNAQFAGARWLQRFLRLFIEQLSFHPEEGQRSRAWLQFPSIGDRRDHHTARFRLNDDDHREKCFVDAKRSGALPATTNQLLDIGSRLQR